MSPQHSKAKTSDVCASSPAGIWFPYYVDLEDHPKTKALVELTGDEKASWHLSQLWRHLMRFRQSGRIEFRASSSTGPLWGIIPVEKPILTAARLVAQWSCMKSMEPMQWLGLLVQIGWLDFEGDENEGVISAHEWEQYGGRLFAQREQDAERQRIRRKKESKAKALKQGLLRKKPIIQRVKTHTSGHVSGGRTSDIHRTSGLREEERREEKTITTTPNPSGETFGNAALDCSEPLVVGDRAPHIRLVHSKPHDVAHQWRGMLEAMRNEGQRYAAQNLEAVVPLSFEADVLTLGVADKFGLAWVEDHYTDTMTRAAASQFGRPVRIELVIASRPEEPKPEELTEETLSEDAWWKEKERLRAKAGLRAEKNRPEWFSEWFQDRKREGVALGTLTSYAVWLKAVWLKKGVEKFGWVDRHWPLDSFKKPTVWATRLPVLHEAM